VLKVREVLDHAEENFLSEVVQIAGRHASTVEPAQDQRPIKFR